MKKWKILSLVLLAVLLLLQSSCLSKKRLIKTETITVTKVDTIIKVVRDTVLKTVSVPLYDTAKVETETAIAKSFYNISTQKIELQLKGKIFDVPVQLQKTQYIKQKEKIKEFSTTKAICYSFVFLLIMSLLFLIIKILK